MNFVVETSTYGHIVLDLMQWNKSKRAMKQMKQMSNEFSLSQHRRWFVVVSIGLGSLKHACVSNASMRCAWAALFCANARNSASFFFCIQCETTQHKATIIYNSSQNTLVHIVALKISHTHTHTRTHTDAISPCRRTDVAVSSLRQTNSRARRSSATFRTKIFRRRNWNEILFIVIFFVVVVMKTLSARQHNY